MGKVTGFLEYDRVDGPVVSEEERLRNFYEFHALLPLNEQCKQAARCMDCGVPFCQAGAMIAGMASGCPLHNLVPEMNDLVYQGCMEKAYQRLSMTHSFPEFTSRVCPALCEAACTCGLHGKPVSTKENEKTVIEYAYEHGLVKETAPEIRTGKKVAVVGSGPSGLAAAQLLNRRGHKVTVFERKDRVGGLLRYGIPNMKLDKSVIDRRVRLMEEAGIEFIVNANIGAENMEASKTGKPAKTNKSSEAKNGSVNLPQEISVKSLMEEYDAVILACGASNPRDIKAPGREADGIFFAVDFLGRVTKWLLDTDFQELETDQNSSKKAAVSNNKAGKNSPYSLVKGKDVVVIGGGDTGNDCVGTSLRLGAKSVTQLEMMPKPPEERTASNPWPEWPKVGKTDYGQEEAIYVSGHDPRIYQTTVKEFVKDKTGALSSLVIVDLVPKKDEKTGRMNMVPVEGSERTIPAQLVLIAAGFLGSESYVTDSFGVEVDGRTNVKTEPGKYATSVPGIYAAGDMHRGQSLVVWAIAEGRGAAREVDRDLMGYTNL